MPNVVVETVENTLKIYLKGWHNNLGKDMTVILPYNAALTSVDLSGASEFHSEYGLIKSGLSQRDLDRRAGIHSVLMMENSDPDSAAYHISSEDYIAISSVLGVSVDELYRTDLPKIVET